MASLTSGLRVPPPVRALLLPATSRTKVAGLTSKGRWRIAMLGLELLFTAALIAGISCAQNQPGGTILKTERFDHDPGWEAFNSRVEPKHIPTVTQDFGYNSDGQTGRERGAIGGRVTRSSKPAYYADKIPVQTLNDKLSASGSFRPTASSGGS